MLRFTIEPLGPDASGLDRRDEATREMRRLVAAVRPRRAALVRRAQRGVARPRPGANWTTAHSSARATTGTGCTPRRSTTSRARSRSTRCRRRCSASRRGRAPWLPGLVPLFTTHRLPPRQRRPAGHLPASRAAAPRRLGPLLDASAWAQLPGLMQIVRPGAGRPVRAARTERCCSRRRGARTGPEFEIYVAAGRHPRPAAELPRPADAGAARAAAGAAALVRWMGAFTPEDGDWPGRLLGPERAHDAARPRRASACTCGRSSSSRATDRRRRRGQCRRARLTSRRGTMTVTRAAYRVRRPRCPAAPGPEVRHAVRICCCRAQPSAQLPGDKQQRDRARHRAGRPTTSPSRRASSGNRARRRPQPGLAPRAMRTSDQHGRHATASRSTRPAKVPGAARARGRRGRRRS